MDDIPLAPVEEEIKILQYEGQFSKVIQESRTAIGDTAQMAFKIALQVFESRKPVVFIGDMILSKTKTIFPGLQTRDPAAAARNVENALCFDSETNTIQNLKSIIDGGNFTYICINSKKPWKEGTIAARTVARRASYTATASVSHVEDYVSKLMKCRDKEGVKFIEVLSPNTQWGIETSDTVSIARKAVDALLWPLFEVDKKVNITKIPDETEEVSRYASLAKISHTKDEAAELKAEAEKVWKRLLKGML